MDAMNGVGLGFLALAAVVPTWACTVSCVSEQEVRRDFTVEVSFLGRPLEGAEIRVEARRGPPMKFGTAPDGKVLIHLDEGEYHLEVTKFGIFIGNACTLRVTKDRGKKELMYALNNQPVPVSRMSGRITESQVSYDRAVHRATESETPMTGREIIMHSFSGPDRKMTMAENGTFDFGDIPPGIYELAVNQAYSPLLLQVDPRASRRDLDLIAAEGMCGYVGFIFRDDLER